MSLWCVHAALSEPDDDGVAVCLRCGSSVAAGVLTGRVVRDGIERVRRDGYHSMRCVDTGADWVCADDCPSRTTA